MDASAATRLECSGCGRKFSDPYDCSERAVRDLPWSEFRTSIHIEVYRVKCPECGVRVEKVSLVLSKAPFSKRFEDAVGQACESASAGGSVWQRARCRRSICAISSDGLQRGTAGAAPDARGRDLPGEERQIPDRSEQSGNGRAVVVWQRREEREAGRVLPNAVEKRPKETRPGMLRGCVGTIPAQSQGWVPGCRIVYDKFRTIQQLPTTRSKRSGAQSSSGRGRRCAI
jgi:ribosomal protein S27E